MIIYAYLQDKQWMFCYMPTKNLINTTWLLEHIHLGLEFPSITPQPLLESNTLKITTLHHHHHHILLHYLIFLTIMTQKQLLTSSQALEGYLRNALKKFQKLSPLT